MADKTHDTQQAKQAVKKQRTVAAVEHAQREMSNPMSEAVPAMDSLLANLPAVRPEQLLTLQRKAGNRAISQLIQTKLTVGPAHDRYEQEADRIAQQVMAMPASAMPAPAQHQLGLQRAEEEEELQMKPGAAPLMASIAPLVQREAAPEEEEELQAKPIVQRAPEEEEEIQTKSLVQRQAASEEEEEEIQTKPIVQRAPEEEEEIQTKSLVQREAGPEEEEEQLQAKPLLQRETPPEAEEEEIQTKPTVQRAAGGAGFEAGGDFEQRLASHRGGGASLPDSVRSFMEPRFGADFSSVRIHTGGDAVQLNRDVSAQAITHGQDIYLGEGKTDLESAQGKQLLAHELTHVIQQTGGVRRKAISSRIHAAPRGQVQRLPTVAEFKEQTYEGFFSGRGKTLKAIEALLAEYHALPRPFSKAQVDKAVEIVSQIREMTKMWIDEHTGDKARTKRMVGMQAFLQDLETKDVKDLEEMKKKITGTTFNVPQQVSNPNEKVKTLRVRYQGNADSVFTKAAWMIDMAVPNKGEKSSLEVEVQFPVDPSGAGFIGGRLSFEAEREDLVKVRCEASLTGGGKIPGGVELKGELGGYFESAAKDAATALKLVSYALYRRFVESSWIPREISNFIWGGTTSFAGYKRAERWASKVEQEAFGGTDETTKSTYVETGMLAGVKAEAGIDLGSGAKMKVGGGAKYTLGTRYTKASVESKKQQFLTQKGQFTTGKSAIEQTYTPSMRGAQAKFGKSVHVLEVGAEADVGLLKGEGKLTFKWAAPDTGDINSAWYQREAEFDGLEFELVGALSMPLGTRHAITPIIQAFVGNAVTGVRAKLMANKNAAQYAGNIANFASDTGGALSALASNKIFEAKFDVGEEQTGLSGTADYRLRFNIGYSPSEGLEVTIAIESAQETSLNLEVFKGKQKKVRRIFGFKYKKGGGWELI